MIIPRLRRLALATLSLTLATALRAQAQQAPGEPADSARQAPESPDGGVSARARRIEGMRIVAPRERRDAYAVLATRTATRTMTPLRDTPQSATVLTHAVIADQAMQSMADVLRYVPGVTMAQGEGNRDAPVIRGQATTADFFVDGVRDDAQYLRDLYNVERIEALKGSNAMIFGRGGGGGIINQVRKEASWTPVGALTIEGGSFEHKRGTLDVGRPLGERAAVRLDAMYERSSGFRDAARISRSGVTPTMTIIAGAGTTLRFDYEHFHDDRTADRGIPSFRGAPAPAPITAFFGDPGVNVSRADVDAGTILIDRALGAGVSLRNRTRAARYDKFYQNVVPGSVDSTGAQVELRGYNNAHDRSSIFNQTDLTASLFTGAVKHTLLAGAELSRQSTDNFRTTGYFGDATTLTVPFANADAGTGVQFRQSATDADNRVRVDVGALYVQDQVELGPHWQAIAGVRVDAFTIRFHDDRDGGELARYDRLVSPRAGLIFKPVTAASLYASYGVSHLPSSGDQFSSLTATTETLEPERFRNLEIGAKWDVHSSLSLTGAVFRLDRNNSTAPDPLDPSRIVQTGAQRSTGYELGATGALSPSWQVVAGWSAQTARITSATRSGAEGATVPLVPRSTLSLWNRVQLAPSVGAGLGAVYQARMYAAIDNTVTLPAFTRYDAALFVRLPFGTRAQLNVENVLGTRYYATSQGNNNIMPGAPRTLRLSLGADF